MQLATKLLGGKVERSEEREYGPATLEITDGDDLFYNVPEESGVTG